ncbi:hypothetical protein OF83DRAFT_1178569 [Amylostereum chailletii]|nr:hypothetical protein OF83DRAFT_1178569 [Amylostereum chailletii]
MNFTTALSSSGKPAVSLAALVYDMLSSRAAAGFRLQTLRIDMLVPNLGDDRPEEEIRKTAPVDAFLSRLLDVVDELQWMSYSNGIVSSLTSPVEPPLTFGSLRHSTGAFARSAPFSVVHDGKSYPTSTHLLEAMKFLPHRPDISESIREAQDDREAERISTRENLEIREDWEQIAQEKADEVKFVQNEGARRMLLLTGNMKLIYEDPDSCWRDRLLKKSMGSEEWNGVGDSLMRVRRRLRRET